MDGDHAVDRIGEIHIELLDQMVAQVHRVGERVLEIEAALLEAAAPSRAPAREGIGCGAPAAREVGAVPGFVVLGVEPRPGGGVQPGLVREIAALALGRVLRLSRGVGRRSIGLSGPARLAPFFGPFAVGGLGPLEQRVLLDLVLDESRELEVRHLQQLDRLLQLGRHDERLGLAQIEACRDRHGERGAPGYRLNRSPR